MELNKLGLKYDCDKSDIHHTFNGNTYLDIYEKFFAPLKDKNIVFLELGVKTCRSIQIWQEYFKSAKIVGVDIDDSGISLDNFYFEHGSQADASFISSVIRKHGPFDVILDDASHVNELSIKSFNLLRNALTPGGLYIIEDLRNSHEDITRDIQTWPGMHLNKNVNYNNKQTRPNLERLLLDIVKDMDYKSSDFSAIHFYSQQLIMEKCS